MSEPRNGASAPTDEQLVAYLDDRLSPSERAPIDAAIAEDATLALRVQWLDRSSLPFRQAYDEVLGQAPTQRLHAMLDNLPGPVAKPFMNRRRFLAAAAGFVAAGVVADRLFIGWQTLQNEKNSWRGLVADYMSMYVPQTLEHLASDDGSLRAQLHTVGQRLALDLQPAQLKLPAATFKRAQVLEYDEVAIAQITYLDPDYGPLALCVTRSPDGVQPFAREKRHNMNVVYWSDARHAWMLIGHNPASELDDLARLLHSRLNA